MSTKGISLLTGLLCVWAGRAARRKPWAVSSSPDVRQMRTGARSLS
ncbi:MULTISPECIES: hypothetical protein [Pseudomonas]|nr:MULTISPECIES: hypothetical protein [unclassified Pseudomonas]MBW8127172.1 hypothetical protein [Pseudomonas sp. LAP_36]MBW8134807.1 hypothetical protein [Pseudomonas sp. PAMC 26818]